MNRTFTLTLVLLGLGGLWLGVFSCSKKTDPVPVPTAGFSYSSASNGSVSFTDQSQNADSYTWDFGDASSSSTDKNPVHTFAKNGTYRVTQTVKNTSGSNAISKDVLVSSFASPVAQFSVVQGLDGLVTFTNTSLNADTYLWFFGDGTTATDKVPAPKTYTKNGAITISLTATGKGGTNKTTLNVDINTIKPIADFMWSEAKGTVTFVNTSKNADSYSWDFGDGRTSTDDSPQNSYAKNGTFTVTLTATNKIASIKKSTSITVSQVTTLTNTNQTVYAASNYGSSIDQIFAFDAKTGAIKWKSPNLGGLFIRGNPTWWQNLVFTADEKGVYALNDADGSIKWSISLPATQCSPLVVNGVLYISSSNGTVVALDALSGARKWTFTTAKEVWASPLVVNGILFVGDRAGNFYAIDVATGTQKWRNQYTQAIFSTASHSGTTIYLSGGDSYTYALSAADGHQLWRTMTGSVYTNSPTVSGSFVYVIGDGRTLLCLDKTTGSIKWQKSLGSTFSNAYSSPAVNGGLVLILFNDILCAFDTSTGATQWIFTAKTSVNGSSPTLANGVVYVGAGDGTSPSSPGYLHAVNALTGALIFTTQATGLVGLPCVIDEKGNVFHSNSSGANQ